MVAAWFKNGLTLWAENAEDLVFQGLQDSRYTIHKVTRILYLVSIASCELLGWKVGARHGARYASPLLNREMNHPDFNIEISCML